MYKMYAKLRDEKGVTDYQVSKDTGISPSALSNWKHGNYNIKIDKLMKIADYFGVPITELIEEKE